MGFLDRLFENSDTHRAAKQPNVRTPPTDAQALERYRYMINTAPPDTVEQAHAEAFAQLTPDQRRQVLAELARGAPAAERVAIEATSSDEPRAMARLATRAEIRQPGTMERALGGSGAGFGTSLLSSFAMGFVGSMVAQSFFSAIGGGGDAGAADDAGANDPTNEELMSDDTDYGGDDGGEFEI